MKLELSVVPLVIFETNNIKLCHYLSCLLYKALFFLFLQCTSKYTVKGREKKWGWALAAPSCNPSYSGGRDQNDPSLKLAPVKLFLRPYVE
jgi:hypothetical protein